MNNKSEMCRFLLNKGASLEIKNFIKTGRVTQNSIKIEKKQQLKNQKITSMKNLKKKL